MCAGAFASFGAGSTIQPPSRISGEAWIAIGSGVFIGESSWMQILPEADTTDGTPKIVIGDGTVFGGFNVLSAACSIRIGKRVGIGRYGFIADHGHAYATSESAIIDQGIRKARPIEIGDGAWLGENVYVGPGVRIGRGAVVGANAVVLDDVPDYSVAVGVPTRVITTFRDSAEAAQLP
jgi:acetyltransferase-like isoleucine patch superfamily enzyme